MSASFLSGRTLRKRDPKLQLAPRGLPPLVETADARALRPAPAPLDHRLDAVARAFEDRLDGAVGEVADAARDAERTGARGDALAEADALHAALHDQPNAHELSARRTPPPRAAGRNGTARCAGQQGPRASGRPPRAAAPTGRRSGSRAGRAA